MKIAEGQEKSFSDFIKTECFKLRAYVRSSLYESIYRVDADDVIQDAALKNLRGKKIVSITAYACKTHSLLFLHMNGKQEGQYLKDDRALSAGHPFLFSLA